MRLYFAKFIILLVSSASLFAGRDLNLKYERLWTDLLPDNFRLTDYSFGKSKNNFYKSNFRKKYIGLFVFNPKSSRHDISALVEFSEYLKKYAEKHEKNISIFSYGCDSTTKKLFEKSKNKNIFLVYGSNHNRKFIPNSGLEIKINYNDDYGPESTSPKWLLIFDDRGRYVDNVRIEIINDVNETKKYCPWEK